MQVVINTYTCGQSIHLLDSSLSISSVAMASTEEVIIIGAGMSGIAMGIQLKTQLHVENFQIFEKMDEVGGTWAQNIYPNLSCDVPSQVSV